MVPPFIALPRSVLAVTAGSVGWKQVISLRLTSMPNLSLRGLHVGPAGLGEAGRPPSGPPRPLTWPRLCSALVHSLGKWVLEILVLLGCFVDLWMDFEAFRYFQLDQGLTLDLEPLDCVTLSLVRSRGLACGGARPAGLGEAGRPPLGRPA